MKFNMIFFILLISMLSVNAQPVTQTSKDTAISKLVIYNKTDKDKWDWIEKFLPSILALSAIGLSMYSIYKQSTLSQDQLNIQIRLAQIGINEKSIRKKIDDLIAKTETIMRLFFDLIEKTRELGYSEDKLLTIIKNISSTSGTLRLYIPVIHEDYKLLASKVNDLTTKAGEFYNSYTGSLEEEKKFIEVNRLRGELLTAENELIDVLHAVIEVERFKLERLSEENVDSGEVEVEQNDAKEGI